MTEGKPKREAPWSVRGVAPEARTAASLAARKTGQTPGQWLTRIIMDAATRELKHSHKFGPTPEQLMAQLMQTVTRLQAEVDALKEPPEKNGFRLFRRSA